MSLIDKQHLHSVRLAKLILYAESLGYQISGGDWYRDQRCEYGHDKSLHRLRLATDLNLFYNGTYLQDSESHRPLGEYWKKMGGTWGGDFDDGNHYSTPHNGMR
jgi:hypothetical protein